MPTYIDTLAASGLEPSVAAVYVALLELGESQVPAISLKTSLSRASIYEALTHLIAEGYIEYRKEGRNAYYKPNHPEKLRDLVAQKKREVALLEGEMGETIQGLIGAYNLSLRKPGVSFYEGKDGIIQAYEELLTIGENIDSIEDRGEMGEFIPEYAKTFVKKRIAKKIHNRVVAPSTNVINITSDTELRETRTLPLSEFPFSMDIKISGNTVLLITLKEQQAVGIKISHPEIANNFKLLFNFLWNHAALRAGSDSPPSASTTDA